MIATKISPNQSCICGSGAKFKKCCGPRGGLTQIEYDEVQAYREDEARERAKRPRSRGDKMPFLLYFASMCAPAQAFSSPAPRPSISRRGR